MTIAAGPEVNISIFTPTPENDELFSTEHYGDPLRVRANENYLSLGITASVSPGISDSVGRLGFGFDVGGDIALTNYKPFPVTPSEPTFASALTETLQEFTIPGGLQDLETMSPGTIATVEGRGSLKFSGTANLLSAVNPLASISLPAPLPAGLQVVSGASISVGASYELSSEYQIRLQKLDEKTVRLGYYKKRSSEFKIKASAKSGISVKPGNFDLTARLITAISSNAQADEDELQRAGLGASQIDTLEDTLKAGIERKLELSASFELGSLRSNEAAFLYEIQLDSVDERGREALAHALRGDLSRLTENEETLPPGIRMVRSIFTGLRRKKHTLKVNLVGIYNFISVSKLTVSGTITYEPESGELLIVDKATASSIAVGAVNFGPNAEKIREVLAESFLITAAYRSSKLVAQAPELKTSHSYFELHARTNRQTMKDNLDVAQAFGLLSPAEKEDRLDGVDNFGRTALFAEARYDEALTTALFLDGEHPRSEDEYEQAGREALQLLVQDDDPDGYRRRAATDDQLWRRMKDRGQANFKPLFPDLGPPQLAAVVADYSVIVWWAKAMRATGEKLAELRKFFAANPSPEPGNNVFQALRRDLAKHLESVAKNTRKEFGDPWGLVAMDLASGRRAEVKIQFTGPLVAFQVDRGTRAIRAGG